jgi:hypothetical protein
VSYEGLIKCVGKDVEGSGRDLLLRYCPSIFLEELRKATKNLSQDSRSAGRDLNPGPPEYEARLSTTSQCDFNASG